MPTKQNYATLANTHSTRYNPMTESTKLETNFCATNIDEMIEILQQIRAERGNIPVGSNGGHSYTIERAWVNIHTVEAYNELIDVALFEYTP